MQTGQPSTTAEIVAFFRALETIRPGDRLFEDPFAAHFLRPWLRIIVRGSVLPLIGALLLRWIDRRWPGARTSAIARTRLIDDWVNESVAGDPQQVLILGAGFDSRAWRLPALRKVAVFEIDHPATAAEKRRRLAALGIERANVRFVPVDFERDAAPQALARSGFDPTKPVVVIWEGVTNYLSGEAVDATLRWIGSLATGTRLIFTYVHEGVLTYPSAFEGAAQILVAVSSTGEPWTFGLRPEALARYLEARGLKLLADLGAKDYRARYMGEPAKRMRGYEFYRVALAELLGPRNPDGRSVQAEHPVDGPDLRRPQQPGVRHRHGVQRPLQVLAPKREEFLQHRKLRPDVVLLPNIGLQQPRVIRPAVEDPGGGEPIALKLAAKILRDHRCPLRPR